MRRWMGLAALVLAAVAVAGCGDAPKEEGKAVTTPSGVTYFDIKVGTGKSAGQYDRVRVHYVGRLVANDEKFDSSRDRGEPFEFTLGKGDVIKGWDDGVAGMKVGGKRRLVIPSKLGYGERGAGAKIPPNADLMFEIDLLEIK